MRVLIILIVCAVAVGAAELQGQQVLISDSANDCIWILGDGGALTELSGTKLGAGIGLMVPEGLAHRGRERIFVVDSGLDELIEIDPASGDRSVVDDVGSGIEWQNPRDLAILPDGSCFVVDNLLNAIVSVDLSSGARAIFSEGITPHLQVPAGICHLDGMLYIVDTGLRAVIAVDPADGARSIVSDDNTGTGDFFVWPRCITATLDGTIIVGDSGLDAFIAVDPITGNRTLHSAAASPKLALGRNQLNDGFTLNDQDLAPLSDPGSITALASLGYGRDLAAIHIYRQLQLDVTPPPANTLVELSDPDGVVDTDTLPYTSPDQLNGAVDHDAGFVVGGVN